MSGFVFNNAIMQTITLPQFTTSTGQPETITIAPSSTTSQTTTLMLIPTNSRLQLSCNINVEGRVTVPDLYVPLASRAPIHWRYNSPYDAGTFAIVQVSKDAANNTIVNLTPFTCNYYENASASWIGADLNPGVFQNTPAAPLLPYVPFTVLAQNFGDQGGVLCQVAFDAGNATNPNDNPQWYETKTGVIPSDNGYYAMLVPGLLPQQYVMKQKQVPRSGAQYISVVSTGASTAKIGYTSDLSAAAIVYTTLTLPGLHTDDTTVDIGGGNTTHSTHAVVFVFEDPAAMTLWTMDSSDLCQSDQGETGFFHDVALLPAINNPVADFFLMPGFCLSRIDPAYGVPLNAVDLNYDDSAFGCFQPVSEGCSGTETGCLLKDTAFGSLEYTAGTPVCAAGLTPTADQIADVKAFVANTCYAYNSSCDCAGTPATVNTSVCEIACTAPELGLSSYCASQKAAFCEKFPTSKTCGGSGGSHPTTSSSGSHPTTSSGGQSGTTSSGGSHPTTSSSGSHPTTSSGGQSGTTSSGGSHPTTSSGGQSGTTSSGGSVQPVKPPSKATEAVSKWVWVGVGVVLVIIIIIIVAVLVSRRNKRRAALAAGAAPTPATITPASASTPGPILA